MNKYNRRFFIDAAERIGWTFAQAGLATVSVEALDLPTWLIIPAATGLAALKTWVAKRVGEKGTAALLPVVQGESDNYPPRHFRPEI